MWFQPLISVKLILNALYLGLEMSPGSKLGPWGFDLHPTPISFLMDTFLHHEKLLSPHKHINCPCSKVGTSPVCKNQRFQGKLYPPPKSELQGRR